MIALLPALFWGSVVIINVFVGGGPYNQIRGTTLGTLFIGFSLLATGHAAFDNLTVIIVGLVSGALWAFGQGNQLKSVHLIGVSKTMPISTGMQLVGTTLFSAIFLSGWSTIVQVVMGLIAMILLVVGISLTSLKPKAKANPITQNLKSNGNITSINNRLRRLCRSWRYFWSKWYRCSLLPINWYGNWRINPFNEP